MIVLALTLIIGGIFVLGYNVSRLADQEPPIEGIPTVPVDLPDEWYNYVPPERG